MAKIMLTAKNIRRILWFLLLVSVLAGSPACAGQPTTAPASAPTAASSPGETRSADANAPAETPVDPAVMKILRALEQAGDEHRTVRADLEMTVLLPQLGDSERRTGWVAIQREPSGEGEKIRVHFETLQLGSGPDTRQREDYTFDGQWAVEAKHSVKQITRRQVAAEGERIDALRIGKGSFPPLPFGQKASEVLEYYQATTRPPTETDPPDSDYLHLTVRPQHRQDVHFQTLEMWVDHRTHLPVKIAGTDKDKNTKTVVLKDMKMDQPLAVDTFELKAGFGWTVNIQPLEPREQP